jgi:hypothetical protein
VSAPLTSQALDALDRARLGESGDVVSAIRRHVPQLRDSSGVGQTAANGVKAA